MNKQILIICVVLACIFLTVGVYACIQQNNVIKQDNMPLINNTDINNTSNDEEPVNTQNTKENNVVINVTWKDKTYKQGGEVPLHYTVTNKGKNTVYNIEAYNEDFENHIAL